LIFSATADSAWLQVVCATSLFGQSIRCESIERSIPEEVIASRIWYVDGIEAGVKQGHVALSFLSADFLVMVQIGGGEARGQLR
jgi:hypothetical protein